MLDYTEFQNHKDVRPTKLLVMIHGYGSNKNDLINLSPELSTFLPHALFISPSAPFSFDGTTNSELRQWFSLLDRSKNTLLDNIEIASNIIIKFIYFQLKKLNLSENDLYLLGFSQGTMLTLYMILQSLIRPKLILGYSGMLFNHQWKYNNKNTQVMLIHGKEDQIIPVEEMLSTIGILKQYGCNTSYHIQRHLAHGIDKDGINIGGKFLQKHS